MSTIPRRELRNDISAILRRAERGERLTITVDGRPVAELGPPSRTTQLATAAAFESILADAPADAAWVDDLRQQRLDATVSVDPSRE